MIDDNDAGKMSEVCNKADEGFDGWTLTVRG